MRKQETVVPAAPGYLVIRVKFADASAPAMVETHPVLAWQIEVGIAQPITLPVMGLDLNIEDADRGVFHPGGRVTSCGAEFTSLDVWIDTRREALKRNRATTQPEAGAA